MPFRPVPVTNSGRSKWLWDEGTDCDPTSTSATWLSRNRKRKRGAAITRTGGRTVSPTSEVPFWENATEASLLADPDGWRLVLISDRGRESVFTSRNDVGHVILHENLSNESAVFDHFEERLRAAGYASTRMEPEPGAMAAWWLSPRGAVAAARTTASISAERTRIVRTRW